MTKIKEVRYVPFRQIRRKGFFCWSIFDRMVGDDLLSDATVAKIVYPHFTVVI